MHGFCVFKSLKGFSDTRKIFVGIFLEFVADSKNFKTLWVMLYTWAHLSNYISKDLSKRRYKNKKKLFKDTL